MDLSVRMLKTHVAPLMEARGYHLERHDRRQAWFQNGDGTVILEFNLHNRPDEKLVIPYLQGFQAGKWTFPPDSFYIDTVVVIGPKHMLISPTERRRPLEPFATFVFQPDDVRDAAISFTQRAFEEWIPYLEAVAARGVFPGLELYQALADHTVERARRFARETGLPLSANMETLRALQAHLEGLLPEREEDYPTRYAQLREHLLDMAAFMGEVMIHKFSGEWRWYELTKVYPNMEEAHDEYKVHIPGEAPPGPEELTYGFDPIWPIIMYWNFGSELKWMNLDLCLKEVFECSPDRFLERDKRRRRSLPPGFPPM